MSACSATRAENAPLSASISGRYVTRPRTIAGDDEERPQPGAGRCRWFFWYGTRDCKRLWRHISGAATLWLGDALHHKELECLIDDLAFAGAWRTCMAAPLSVSRLNVAFSANTARTAAKLSSPVDAAPALRQSSLAPARTLRNGGAPRGMCGRIFDVYNIRAVTRHALTASGLFKTRNFAFARIWRDHISTTATHIELRQHNTPPTINAHPPGCFRCVLSPRGARVPPADASRHRRFRAAKRAHHRSRCLYILYASSARTTYFGRRAIDPPLISRAAPQCKLV